MDYGTGGYHAGPLPSGSNRAQILFWLVSEMGVWAPGLFDLPPEVGAEFLALCQAVGGSRTQHLEEIAELLRSMRRG